jgi:hypothetical protein
VPAGLGVGAARRGIVRGHIEYPIATAMPHCMRPAGGARLDTDRNPATARPAARRAVPTDADRGEVLHAVADHGLERRDVGEALFGSQAERAERSGFAIRLDLAEVAPGSYQLRVGLANPAGTAYLPQSIQLEID